MPDALTAMQSTRLDLLRLALDRGADLDGALNWAQRAAALVEEGPAALWPLRVLFDIPADAASDLLSGESGVATVTTREVVERDARDATRGQTEPPAAPQNGGGGPMPAEAPPAIEAPDPAAEAIPLADRVYGLLDAAARAGRPCPTARDMAQDLDDTESMVSGAFAALRQTGRISVEYRTPRRRVQVDGRWTGWTGGWVPEEERPREPDPVAPTAVEPAVAAAVEAAAVGEGDGEEPAPRDTKAKRRCLRCDVVFNSTGPGNRLCPRCLPAVASVSPLAVGM